MAELIQLTEKEAESKYCRVHDNHYLNDGKRVIDYVLVYEFDKNQSDEHENQAKINWRYTYENNLREKGLETEIETIEDDETTKSFVKIHGTWKFLSRQAELMHIKMPIKLCDIKDDDYLLGKIWRKITNKLERPFKLQKELNEPEYFSAPYNSSRPEQFLKRDPEIIFTAALRSSMVHDILQRTEYDESTRTGVGLETLLENGTYTAAFTLHQSIDDDETTLPTEREILLENWVSIRKWYKYQPLDLIYKYFGETIGLYFAWLGFYTATLIPIALLGLICIIYGGLRLTGNTEGDDICNDFEAGNLTMCPVCDLGCPFWKLRESCEYAITTLLFENRATLVYSVVMAIWATCFLEAWKRYLAKLSFQWDLIEDEDIEEKIHPAFYTRATDWRINPVTGLEEVYVSYREKVLRWIGSGVTVVFFLCLVLAFIAGVTVYRVIISHLMEDDPRTQEYASFTTSASASCINLIIIMVLSKVYKGVAYKLTEFEYPRTESEFLDSYSLKVFLFEFINYYSPLFYIAFIKGRFSVLPGKTGKLFGKYNMEQCDPAGCMADLVIQLAIIMIGKQILNNFMEFVFPMVKNHIRNRKWCQKKDYKAASSDEDEKEMSQWEKDLKLNPEPPNMIDDYTEMVIQYGFVTLFVAAFPLAPLFALLNNIIEIRLDAYKFTIAYRRPTAQRAKDLGIWTDILAALSRIAVLTNACVIAFTSDLVPKMLYLATHPSIDGFIQKQLAYLNATQLPNIAELNQEFGENVTVCRFREHRLPPCGLSNFAGGPPESHPCADSYSYSMDFWVELAAKLAFVLIFQNFVYFTKDLLAYLVPDIPSIVLLKMQRQAQLIRESKEQFDKEHESDQKNTAVPQDVAK